MMAQNSDVEVSIILPVYNAEKWLDECLESVLNQKFTGTVELSVFNDACTDGSADILLNWKDKLEDIGIEMILGGHKGEHPKGVGFAKNQAVAQSQGRYLCFLDADDVMDSHRIEMQYAAAQSRDEYTIIGCQFYREPIDSTERYTRWCNTISEQQLITQAYTAHGPTVIMPTWFCARALFEKVGGFDERGKGIPEDLIFFLAHLHNGGAIHRVNQSLLMYRYHPEAATHSVNKETIWDIRIEAFQSRIVNQWSQFTIWNAGKQGRKFYRSLSVTNQRKVIAFCDVDVKKINKGVYIYEESQEIPKPRVKIVHFTDASGPFVICMKQGIPEDLIFFLAHLHNGGAIHRVNQSLLMYRYHPEAATHSVNKETIWDIRIEAFQSRIVNQWSQFTIWNAGKQGRKFYRSLSVTNQRKVIALCDVDVKKINKGVYIYEESQEIPKPRVNIVHFTDASGPFVICMKQDLTGGVFEANLASLKLTEGLDYYFFS